MNDLPSNATLADVTKTVKVACDIIARIRSQNLLPGRHKRDKSHKCGKALPRGVILDARPFFAKAELETFAKLILDGGGRTLKMWRFGLSACGA